MSGAKLSDRVRCKRTPPARKRSFTATALPENIANRCLAQVAIFRVCSAPTARPAHAVAPSRERAHGARERRSRFGPRSPQPRWRGPRHSAAAAIVVTAQSTRRPGHLLTWPRARRRSAGDVGSRPVHRDHQHADAQHDRDCLGGMRAKLAQDVARPTWRASRSPRACATRMKSEGHALSRAHTAGGPSGELC